MQGDESGGTHPTVDTMSLKERQTHWTRATTLYAQHLCFHTIFILCLNISWADLACVTNATT